jgi:PAS domain S-box-containing protein
MAADKTEEERLRRVALQNAQSIFRARQQAEDELVRAKEALERKTQELAHSLAMVRATLEATTDGILVTDGQGKVTDWNEQFVALWRLPREVLDTRDHQHLLSVLSQSCQEPRQFLARMAKIQAAALPETYDVLDCPEDRVVEQVSRIQVVEGRNVGRVWSFRDITARRQAEETRLRLAAIVESSNDAIISKSLDGVITSWNAAAERLFGYRAEEMLGQSILRLLPAERHAEEDMILARLRQGERIEHFETVRQTKAGQLIDVSVTISPLRDEGGRIIGASKIARDITERKRAEAERAQLLAALQRSNAELQQFASVASHDLQEPLRMVTTFVQLLAQRWQGRLAAEDEEFIGYAVEGAQRMKGLIDALLDFARVAAREKPFAPVDCTAVVRRTLQTLQAVLRERQARIEVEPLPTVLGDEVQVGQVFQNLLSNALKFCPTRPQIHIAARRDGAQWVFAVRDNGIGIAPHHAEQIFVLFRRLHTHQQYPGTGMGLAICKKIVERHGGRIWVESVPGHGSTFSFTLPAG